MSDEKNNNTNGKNITKEEFDRLSNEEKMEILFSPEVREMELEIENNDYHERFIVEKNKSYGVHSFLASMEQGKTPPDWVMEWLHESFLEFDLSGGTKRIDKCLGLTHSQDGCTAVKRRGRVHALENHLREVWELKTIYNISTESAARLVCSKPRDEFSGYTYGEGTLIDYYNRKWGKGRFRPHQNQINKVQRMTIEQKVDRLKWYSASDTVKNITKSLQR